MRGRLERRCGSLAALVEAVGEQSPFIRFPGDVPISLVGSSRESGWSDDPTRSGPLNEEPPWPMIALSAITGISFVCI